MSDYDMFEETTFAPAWLTVYYTTRPLVSGMEYTSFVNLIDFACDKSAIRARPDKTFGPDAQRMKDGEDVV